MSAINGKGEGESGAATTFKTEPIRKYLPACLLRSQRSYPGTVSEATSCSCLSRFSLHPPPAHLLLLLLHHLTCTCSPASLSSPLSLSKASPGSELCPCRSSSAGDLVNVSGKRRSKT